MTACVQEFLERLQSVLRQFPPPHPKKPAVDMLVAVGDQQRSESDFFADSFEHVADLMAFHATLSSRSIGLVGIFSTP